MISKERELRKAVEEAVKVLRNGGVILYPTPWRNTSTACLISNVIIPDLFAKIAYFSEIIIKKNYFLKNKMQPILLSKKK